MRFLIGGDTGATIHGWIVPDNPLALSRVAVRTGGRQIAEVETSIFDENFLKFGWHSTGHCSFEITEADVPGLAQLADLELYDADTNVRLHRRVKNLETINTRFFLVQTGIYPEVQLQNLLFPYFQHSYFGLHKLSDEVINSIFTTPAMSSLFLTGSINVPRYENFMMPEEMLTAILFHDPYVEMATRLTWLQAKASEAADETQRWRLGAFIEAANLAGQCNLSDVRSLRRFFRVMPEAAYRLLYNPFIRQLGTRMPDDRVLPGNSIAAIEVLARLGIVGHYARFDVFTDSLSDRLGLSLPALERPVVPPEVDALAERLRTLKEVREMLIFDIALTDLVLNTIDKAWSA